MTFPLSDRVGRITDVVVAVDMHHSFVGDVGARLIAPDGSTSVTLFDRTGVSMGNDEGDDSDLAGPFVFTDGAPTSPSLVGGSCLGRRRRAIPHGQYRARRPVSGRRQHPDHAGLRRGSVRPTARGHSASSTADGLTGSVDDATLYVATDGVAPEPLPVPDTTAPETILTTAPAGGIAKALVVPFAFGSSEAGSSFLCSMDGAAYAACSTPTSATVTSGAHTFRVVARDAAGNVDASPASATFTAYDCQALDSKVTQLSKVVKKLKKAVKATKKKVALAEDAGDKAKVTKLTTS